MKKIYYLLAFVALAFTACQKQPYITPATYTKAMTLTLAHSDYLLLPTTAYPYKTFTFDSPDDANKYIPMILNARDPQLGDGSTASVTYATTALTLPATPKLADSTFDNVSYKLTNSDYLLLPGNKFTDFSAAQILNWLPIYYTKPVANQLALLTFTYYENGVTSTVAQSFLYLSGAWKKIYTITLAQYASIGKGGTFNDFSSSDDAQLTNYFNTLLKADLAVSSTVKRGDVQYVSYKYFGSKNFQRVTPLIFDGTNWTTTPILPSTTPTLSFAKNNGTWVPNSDVNYTLVKDDYTYIGTQTKAGSDAARANVAQFPDFNISANTDPTYWSDADITAALIAVLGNKYKSTTKNQKYIITYTVYSFGKTSNVAKTFIYDGSAFVVPK